MGGGQPLADGGIDLFQGPPCAHDLADRRQDDRSVAIHQPGQLEIHSAPDVDDDLIPYAQAVICGHRPEGRRLEQAGIKPEKSASEKCIAVDGGNVILGQAWIGGDFIGHGQGNGDVGILEGNGIVDALDGSPPGPLM